jgi:alpha-galactosidase
VPDFFKMVYNTTYSINKDAVVQICPCGTNFSLYNIPYTTQFVASDPSSSWQVRHRGKVFKALVGNAIPYAGDHVELTSRSWVPEVQKSLPFKEDDFASTIGVGGVVASKFTLPDRKQIDSTVMLTPEKEIKFKHWEEIYNTEKLSEGDYVNLYDIAYDIPETHLIKRNSVNYYSFFSDAPFDGKVELRGLDKGKYEITDYVNNVNLGIIDSTSPYINIKFTGSMLVKAVKQN